MPAGLSEIDQNGFAVVARLATERALVNAAHARFDQDEDESGSAFQAERQRVRLRW